MIAIGSAIGGTAMILSSSNDCEPLDDTCEPVDSGMLWGGVGVGVGGVLIGVVMAMKKDEAEVTVASAPQVRRPAITAYRHAGAGRGRFVVPILSGSF